MSSFLFEYQLISRSLTLQIFSPLGNIECLLNLEHANCVCCIIQKVTSLVNLPSYRYSIRCHDQQRITERITLFPCLSSQKQRQADIEPLSVYQNRQPSSS